MLNQAAAAGATILKPAQKVFWGAYSVYYFADLDGHVWEVALNPAWTINNDETGTDRGRICNNETGPVRQCGDDRSLLTAGADEFRDAAVKCMLDYNK